MRISYNRKTVIVTWISNKHSCKSKKIIGNASEDRLNQSVHSLSQSELILALLIYEKQKRQ